MTLQTGAWLHGVQRTLAKTAAASRNISHVTAKQCCKYTTLMDVEKPVGCSHSFTIKCKKSSEWRYTKLINSSTIIFWNVHSILGKVQRRALLSVLVWNICFCVNFGFSFTQVQRCFRGRVLGRRTDCPNQLSIPSAEDSKHVEFWAQHTRSPVCVKGGDCISKQMNGTGCGFRVKRVCGAWACWQWRGLTATCWSTGKVGWCQWHSGQLVTLKGGQWLSAGHFKREGSDCQLVTLKGGQWLSAGRFKGRAVTVSWSL